MEAERNAKLAAAREAQRALDQEADKDAQPVVEKQKKAKKIPAALNMVETKKAEKAAAPAVANLKETKKAKTAKPATPTAVVAGTVPAGEKFCKRHNTTHPLEEFASDRSSKDGRYSICRRAEKEDRLRRKEQQATALPMAAMPAPAPVKKAGKKGGTKKATK
jgi:hypothetical protein